MSEELKELGQMLQAHYNPMTQQTETCESKFTKRMRQSAQKLAFQGVQDIIDASEEWIACRFDGTSDTQRFQAQLSTTDVIKAAWSCAWANIDLIDDGVDVFLASVGRCVAAKLLGNIGGGIFSEKPVGRC